MYGTLRNLILYNIKILCTSTQLTITLHFVLRYNTRKLHVVVYLMWIVLIFGLYNWLKQVTSICIRQLGVVEAIFMCFKVKYSFVFYILKAQHKLNELKSEVPLDELSKKIWNLVALQFGLPTARTTSITKRAQNAWNDYTCNNYKRVKTALGISSFLKTSPWLSSRWILPT